MTSGFERILMSTQKQYPLCTTKEEALNYLNYINQNNFTYTNFCNYDVLDYEKIIYIEINFPEEEIQTIVKELKEKISRAYFYKKNYLNRISDTIPQENFIDVENQWDDNIMRHMP